MLTGQADSDNAPVRQDQVRHFRWSIDAVREGFDQGFEMDCRVTPPPLSLPVQGFDHPDREIHIAPFLFQAGPSGVFEIQKPGAGGFGYSVGYRNFRSWK